jgi:hypothetical protein
VACGWAPALMLMRAFCFSAVSLLRKEQQQQHLDCKGELQKKKHCIGGWCLFGEQQRCDDVQIACREWEHCRARRWRWVKSAMCRRVEQEEEERLALLLRESPQGWRPVLTALLVSIVRKM